MPKYLILENVRNLASHDDGNTWKVIKQNINDMGYHTYDVPLILNVLHFNIPQNRERVIILCKRKDIGIMPQFPEIPKNPKKNIKCSVSDIIIDDIDNEKYIINKKMKETESIWNNFIKILINNNIDIPKYPIWTDWWDNDINENLEFYNKYTNWINKNRQFYNENKNILSKWLLISRQNTEWKGAVRKFEWQAGELLKNDGMNTVLWSARSSGIRVKRLNYIPTLVAMNTIPIYGPESRKLTPKELLKMQSFDNSFQYDETTILKQIGNSVNVTMIEKCARFLIYDEQLF
jgi:DNA (cytosine-5)-methyltransferase 1